MQVKSSMHNHTTHSDGKNTPEEMINEAINRGFTHFAITDHVETPGFDKTLKRKDYNSYVDKINELKEKYKDRINLSVGIEGDYYSDEGFLTSDLSMIRPKLDFIVGSIHHVNQGKDIRAVDDSFKIFTNVLEEFFGGDIKAFVSEYFRGYNMMLDALKPEVCGHIDLIKKNNVDNMFFSTDEKWFKKLIYETLEHIKELNAIMEFNTAGACRMGFRALYPSDYAIKKANDMGIKITISSDAHDTEMINSLYNLAVERIKKSGVNTLHTYDSNIKEFVPFKI